MPIALVAAGVAAAGSIAGAAISSNAASNAANTAQQTAAANNKLQQTIYNSNKTELQPYVDRGNTAGNAESDLLGLNGSTSATGTASNNAFNDYLNSAGEQFQLGQGTAAITGSRAANGTLDSGGTLKSLNAYGQGLASNYFQSYLGNLSGISGQGLTGASALAGVGQNYAGAVSANNNNAAATTVNAGLSTASSLNGLIASGVNAYGTTQGLSSFTNPNGGSTASSSGTTANGQVAPYLY